MSFFSLLMISNLSKILIFLIDGYKISYDNSYTYPLWADMMFTYLDLLEHIWFYFFLASNFKNIRFSEWMANVMVGHQMLKNYPSWSVFIQESRFWNPDISKSINVNITSSAINDVDSSLYDSAPLDYDMSDFYMRKYKEKYASK